MDTPRFTHLDQWLRWQESCHPCAIDLGLERVRQVAETLGLLRPTATVITVAGTNGKGSCVATLTALLQETGHRTGCFSSPHLIRYNERIRIDGHEVTDDELCAAFDAIDRARAEISLTYFEFNTLAALYLFARSSLDYWILEVGLGGRLDATNIIDANIAVITSIDRDHEEWLGSDRETIGREKAGICRPGRSVVCSDPSPPQSLLEVVRSLGCDLFTLGDRFGFDATGFRTHRRHLSGRVDLPPASVAAALQVFELLQLWRDQDHAEALVARLRNLGLPGRFEQVMCGTTPVTLDVAHNPAAMKFLVSRLQQVYPQEPLHLVIAMMADKNIEECLAELVPVAAHWYLAAMPDLPRAANCSRLETAIPAGVPVHSFASVESALEQACDAAVRDDAVSRRVVVTGSFFTVGRARMWLDRVAGGDPELHG